MDTPKQEKNLHVALVDPARKQLLLERRGIFIASSTEVSKVELHLPSQILPENTSLERCANRLIQTKLNIATSAFAGLGPVGDNYGYAVRPASLAPIEEMGSGYEVHTEESLTENRDLLADHVYVFALQALAHTQKRHY